MALFMKYPNEAENKKHILLWSGGCDSTLLLYELLNEYGSENVIAITYNYSWLTTEKSNNERIHRDIFKSKMKLLGDKFGNFEHHDFNINVEDNPLLIHRSLNGLPQALGWLFMIPMYAYEDSYIYASYIKGDDFSTGFNHHYSDIFNSVNALLGGSGELTLRLPYIYKNKYEIIEALIQTDLYDATWYCEMPNADGTMCKTCSPCKTHISALVYLSMFSKDEHVKSHAAWLLSTMVKDE